MSIIANLVKKVKRHFTPKTATHPRPISRPQPTIFQALDRSLAYGYASVNWSEVRYV